MSASIIRLIEDSYNERQWTAYHAAREALPANVRLRTEWDTSRFLAVVHGFEVSEGIAFWMRYEIWSEALDDAVRSPSARQALMDRIRQDYLEERYGHPILSSGTRHYVTGAAA